MRVLFVCTGNICRSPMAERLMLARLDPAADVDVASAGTGALVDHDMDGAAALVTREFGGDPSAHRGQAATPELVSASDLVLTATVAHRDEVLRLTPTAMRRSFTMREFGRLGRSLPALPLTPAGGDLPARVAEVAAQRGLVDPPGPGEDDIGDPFGAPMHLMRLSGQQVSSAVDATLQVLGLRPVG